VCSECDVAYLGGDDGESRDSDGKWTSGGGGGGAAGAAKKELPKPNPKAVSAWTRTPTPTLRSYLGKNISDQDRSDIQAAVDRKSGKPKAAHVPGTRPALKSEQYSALAPKSGGWTTASRQQTLDSLKSTDEGSNLAGTLTSFQSGGSTAIPKLRTDIEKNQNGETLPAGRVKSVDTLLGAINGSDASDVHLYRGIALPGTPDQAAAAYKVGTPVNISLGSFTSDPKVASQFTSGGAGQRVKAKTTTPVVFDLDGPKHALPIENLAKSGTVAGEKEWVTSGKFHVTGVKNDGHSVRVSIRQDGPL
jgi:hypothetical protein